MKQVEETRGLVLQSAQREFLDKGYEKASLRSIAQNAGVTTGALYVRFPNKSALFAALVEPVSAHLLGLFRTGNDQGFEQLDEGRAELEDAQAQLDSAKKQIASGEKGAAGQ